MESFESLESLEERYMPMIIIGHVPRFSGNEQICLHVHFTSSANKELLTGIPITKSPEFGLFAFRLTVSPSLPFYVRMQRWARVRMAALQQQVVAESGAEAGDAQSESITVMERCERKLTVYRAWSVVFIEWDRETQKSIHTHATDPSHLFVGKYPTKKFPPSTYFCVRSCVNRWKVDPKVADACQFPENSGLYWTWINANSRDKTEFKMVATIEDDNLNCTIVVWEPLPFMNKVLGRPSENTFFIVFSQWGVYDEKYTAIGLDTAVTYDSKEAARHIDPLRLQEESNPVSMWERFLNSRTCETTRDPIKSASDTSLLTVEAASQVQDEVKVLFCTTCGQEDLGRELEKIAEQKDFGRNLEKLSGQKDFERELEKLTGQKDFERELEKLSGQKYLGNEQEKLALQKEFDRELERLSKQKDLGRELRKLSDQKRELDKLARQKDLGSELEKLSKHKDLERELDKLYTKNLEQQLEKDSRQNELSGIACHVPMRPTFSSKENVRRGEGIAEEMIAFTERDTAASMAKGVPTAVCTFETNFEKSKTYDRKPFRYGTSHCNEEVVLSPCNRRVGDSYVEPARYNFGMYGRVPHTGHDTGEMVDFAERDTLATTAKDVFPTEYAFDVDMEQPKMYDGKPLWCGTPHSRREEVLSPDTLARMCEHIADSVKRSEDTGRHAGDSDVVPGHCSFGMNGRDSYIGGEAGEMVGFRERDNEASTAKDVFPSENAFDANMEKPRTYYRRPLWTGTSLSKREQFISPSILGRLGTGISDYVKRNEVTGKYIGNSDVEPAHYNAGIYERVSRIGGGTEEQVNLTGQNTAASMARSVFPKGFPFDPNLERPNAYERKPFGYSPSFSKREEVSSPDSLARICEYISDPATRSEVRDRRVGDSDVRPTHFNFGMYARISQIEGETGEMVNPKGRDTATSELTARPVFPRVYAFDPNIEKPNAYDRKPLEYVTSHSSREQVLRPSIFAHLNTGMNNYAMRNEVKGSGVADFDVEPVHYNCCNYGKALRTSGAARYTGSEFSQKTSCEDDPDTLKTLNFVDDESRKLRQFRVATRKAELMVCGVEKIKPVEYARIDVSDQRITLIRNTEPATEFGLEAFSPSDFNEEWLVLDRATDSSLTEIVKETGSLAIVPDLAELNSRPSDRTDILAGSSFSDEPDRCCHLSETRLLESNAQGNIGRVELTQKLVLCLNPGETPLMKNALTSEICLDGATPGVMDWRTERKAGYVPGPLYDGDEAQSKNGSDSEMDVLSVFPSADINDVFPELDVAAKDDFSSPIDPIDVVDLPYNFTDVGVGNEDSKQLDCAGDVGSAEPGWHDRAEPGTNALGDPVHDSDACLIYWDAIGSAFGHPANDTIASGVFRTPVTPSDDDESLIILNAFGDSFNDTRSLITRDAPDESSLMTSSDELSWYGSVDSQNTETEGRNWTARSINDTHSPIHQSAMDNLFDLSVNDASLMTPDRCSSYPPPDTQSILSLAGIEGMNFFTPNAAENPVGCSSSDASLINLDEYPSYPSDNSQSIVTSSAETKDRLLTTHSNLITECLLDAKENLTDRSGNEIDRMIGDDYSSFAVADTQRSAEIKSRNLIIHSTDNVNVLDANANEHQSYLSGIHTNLISLDDSLSYLTVDTEDIVTSAKPKDMQLNCYSVATTQGSTDNATDNLAKDTSQMGRERYSSDSLSGVTSTEAKVSDVCVMELYPCDERYYKAYRYFVSETKRMQDCVCNPVSRKFFNDLIPYFETDEKAVSPLPELPDENLNMNNEALDSVDLPEIRGVSRRYLEYCSQSIVLGAEMERERERQGSVAPYDEELPLIPEEDPSADVSDVQSGVIEYPAVYLHFGKTDVADEVKAFAESLTDSKDAEAKMSGLAINPLNFEYDHYSCHVEHDTTVPESTKKTEDSDKILTVTADITDDERSVDEDSYSYEDARDDLDIIPRCEKIFESNPKMFRPFLCNFPDFMTRTYASQCESPPLPKTFYNDSEECCFLDESESTSNDPDCSGIPGDFIIDQREVFTVGKPAENISTSLCTSSVDINPASERTGATGDPAFKPFLVLREGNYQTQQSMNWSVCCSRVKPFQERWKISGYVEKRQHLVDTECHREAELKLSTDQNNAWLSSIEEESGESEDRRLVGDLKDLNQTSEDSLGAVDDVDDDAESRAVFWPQLTSVPRLKFTSYLPKPDRDKARKSCLPSNFGMEDNYFDGPQTDQSQSDLQDLESIPAELDTGDEEYTEITDEYSYPGKKVFRVPKYVLKGIVNYETDYETATKVDEVVALEVDNRPELAELPKGSCFDFSANNQFFSDDQSCSVRREYRKHGSPSDGRSRSPCNISERVLQPSESGSSPTCESPYSIWCSTEAEGLQLPGPESIVDPCLDAWFCSETSRNGKPNTFMIESEAQTEEESTGLLAQFSENVRPSIAEGDACEFSEWGTRYGTAGFTIPCSDRCKSPIKSSASYSGPEADASESSINDSFGNYSLIDSDSGEKCIPQVTISVPSAYHDECSDAVGGSGANESSSAVSSQLIDLEDDSILGLENDDRTVDSRQPTSSCGKSAAGAAMPDRGWHGTVNLEMGGRSGFKCPSGSDPMHFAGDWFLDFDEEVEEKEKRLKAIIARDPKFQDILGGTAFTFSSDQSMDYVLEEDDAFEEVANEGMGMKKETTIEEKLTEAQEIEKEGGNGWDKDLRGTAFTFSSGQCMDYVLEEEDACEEDSKENEEEKGKEDNIEEKLTEADEIEMEGYSGWDKEQYMERFSSMDRPPSPFADDWFTDCGPNKFSDQIAKGSKEYENFIRETATALEKCYEQVLAGTSVLARQVKVCSEIAAEGERELTSDNSLLPGELPVELEQRLRTDDSSIESVYFTPAFSPFYDDAPLDPCPIDSPDFMESAGLESSKDIMEGFMVPRTPVLDCTLVNDGQRCLKKTARGDEEDQEISVGNVPDNRECSARTGPGARVRSTRDIPDISDVGFPSIPDESWVLSPEQEQSSEMNSGRNGLQSGPEFPRSSEHAVLDVAADSLVKKAIDFAQYKIFKTTNSLPFNVKPIDDHCEDGEGRTHPPKCPSTVLTGLKNYSDNDLMG